MTVNKDKAGTVYLDFHILWLLALNQLKGIIAECSGEYQSDRKVVYEAVQTVKF